MLKMQDIYKGDRTHAYPWMKTANHVGKQRTMHFRLKKINKGEGEEELVREREAKKWL